MKKWESFSKEELEDMVRESRSYREIAVKCGYSPDGGGSIKPIKEMIEYYNFDVSHFLGQAWNKDNFDFSRFRKGNAIKANAMLNALVSLRGHQCECCLHTQWNDKPIPLEVHHLDGNNINNELSNLQLLCPNCHAQTENWRGKNINYKKKNTIPEEDFVIALKENNSIRQALLSLGLSAKGGNYTRAREIIIKYNIEKFIK